MTTPIIMASTQTNGGACTTNGAFAQDGTGLSLTCQNNVWISNTACPAYYGDLNVLEGNPGTQFCVNGAGMANAPTGDWFFVNIQRHVNGANYYAVQTAAPMTGSSVGSKYIRVQQSGAAGTGWGAWNKVVTQDAAGNVVIPGSMTANTFVPSLVATAGNGCSPNGSIAQDSTGLTLSCQSGVWTGSSVKGLGFGGTTWHNMTGARSFNTQYTNPYNYPIAVSATATCAVTSSIQGYVNGALVSFFQWQFNGCGSYGGAFILVPPGATYQLNSGQGIYNWQELY
jgi:hypothetical protein